MIFLLLSVIRPKRKEFRSTGSIIQKRKLVQKLRSILNLVAVVLLRCIQCPMIYILMSVLAVMDSIAAIANPPSLLSIVQPMDSIARVMLNTSSNISANNKTEIIQLTPTAYLLMIPVDPKKQIEKTKIVMLLFLSSKTYDQTYIIYNKSLLPKNA